MPTPQEIRAASTKLASEVAEAVTKLTETQVALTDATAKWEAAVAQNLSLEEMIAAGNELFDIAVTSATTLDQFTPAGTPVPPVEPEPTPEP